MKQVWLFAPVMCVAILVGCQTPSKPERPLPPAAQVRFEPAWNISPVQHGEGQYANLFGQGSRAIWIDQRIAELKKMRDSTAHPPPGIDADAIAVSDSYIVIECQLESQFGDMSVAYDAVRLRGIDAYLLTASGKRVSPIQSRGFGSVDEEPVDALKRFSRTSVIIFPRQNLVSGEMVIGAHESAVRLVLEGFGSSCYFEWPCIPSTETGPRMPTPEEAEFAARLGYYELFTGIRLLAHIFD